MNTTHHQTINTKPYNALFGINPRCGLTKKLPDSFLQTGSSEIREEVLAEMLQEELPDVELPYEELPDEELPDENDLTDENDLPDEDLPDEVLPD